MKGFWGFGDIAGKNDKYLARAGWKVVLDVHFEEPHSQTAWSASLPSQKNFEVIVHKRAGAIDGYLL
jgi:hypothetical protein